MRQTYIRPYLACAHPPPRTLTFAGPRTRWDNRLYNSPAPRLYGTNLQYVLGGCVHGNYESPHAFLCTFMHYPPRAWRLHHHTAYKSRLYAVHWRKSRTFPRTKSVPAGLTPGAVQGYAWKRGLRSLAAHRARRIDYYTFKCASRPGDFWAFFCCFCRGRGRS